MTHFRTLIDTRYLAASDLKGRRVTVIIREIVETEVSNENGKDRRPVLFFIGKVKGLVGNLTILRTIGALYGSDYEKWVGKPITLTPARTELHGEEVDCIRVVREVPRPRDAAPEPAGEVPNEAMKLGQVPEEE